MAMGREKIKIGTTKVRAKTNLAAKVIKVDCQISFWVCWFSDSSLMWMPKASDKASATAMTRMPEMTTVLE